MAVLTGTARCTDISSTRFRALLLAGLVVRLLALPLAGTEDVLVWKTWSYGAVSIGPTHLYGVGGIPPERGVVTWGTRHTTVDYPPVALYELTLAGTVYRWFSPEFQDSRWLTVAMKLPAVLAEGLLALLLWRVVRRRHGERAGRFAASAFWANPAMILAGSILGYLDPLMALPAIGAIVAAVEGRPIVAGGLLAIPGLRLLRPHCGRYLCSLFAQNLLCSGWMLVGMTAGALWFSRWPLLAGNSTLPGMLGGMFVGMTWGMVISVALYRGFFTLRNRV